MPPAVPVERPRAPRPRIEPEQRWYAPVLAPSRPAVDAALHRLAVLELTDPWSCPRVGLATALIGQLVRTYGRRTHRGLVRVGAAAAELYNLVAFGGVPSAAERERWLQHDDKRAHRVWRTLLRRDRARVEAVLDRWSAHPLGDRALPEAVLFLRGVVAVGVVAGDVPDALHGVLDRVVTWMGLAWEAAGGESTASGWNGALAAVGSTEPYPADPMSVAVERTRLALGDLPHSALVEALLVSLGRPLEVIAVARPVPAWIPLEPPLPRPGSPTCAGEGFAGSWRLPIEEALLAVITEGEGRHVRSAARFLLHQGGKRVRPLVALASAAACGGDPGRALPTAALVEWIHQTSLVLDDVMDGATVRRNGPTLHTATSTPFALGVFAWLLGQLRVARADVDAAAGEHLVQAAAVLAEGQWTELKGTGHLDLSLADYHRIVFAKTAALFACAAAVGGLAVGASSAQVAALRRYGREAGLAFQIVDDVLDYTGDLRTFGKVPGTDLRARKVTLPVLLLRERLSVPERDRLHAIYADTAPDDADLAWVQERLEAHGVIPDALSRARTHQRRAVDALSALPGAEGVEVLTELASAFVDRRR